MKNVESAKRILVLFLGVEFYSNGYHFLYCFLSYISFGEFLYQTGRESGSQIQLILAEFKPGSFEPGFDFTY